MRMKNEGQSVIEYILVASIVMLGIVVGGPILLKSVQGHFRLTDESVRDATSEVMQQTGANGIPAKSCTCSSGPVALPDSATHPVEYRNAIIQYFTKGDCGTVSTNPTRRYYYRTCSPLKCAQEEAWLPDSTCCSPAKPVQCGTKFQEGSGNTNPQMNCTRASTAVTLDSRFDPGYSRTCDPLTGSNDHDCAVGERLYSKICANAVDPTKNDTIYACKTPSGDGDELMQNCLPSCWEYPFPRSKPCNTDLLTNSMTLEDDTRNVNENNMAIENDDTISIPQRKALIKEVTARLAYPIETPNAPVNVTLDPWAHAGEIAAHYAEAKKATHRPYRVISKNVETADTLKFNAYRNHYTYLKNMGPAGQCSPTRYCERTCPGGYSPNAEGLNGLRENESCTPQACWYGWWPDLTNTTWTTTFDPTAGDKICSSQDEPSICVPNAEICGYIGICFDKTGSICYQSTSSNIPPIRELANAYDQCAEGERKITDRTGKKSYCYKVLPVTDPISLPSTFTCNYKDLYFTVIGCDSTQ